MNEKKFDVVKEVEKQYHMNLKESNVEDDIEEWGSFVVDYSNEPILYLWDNGQDIDPQESEDDPAVLAAEMEQQTELHIANLFEERKKVLEEQLEIEKILLTDKDYDYDHDLLELDAADLHFDLKLIEQEIIELQVYGYIKSSGYTEANITICRPS